MTSPFPKAYADFVQRLRVPAGFVLLGGFVLTARPQEWSILWGLPFVLAGLLLRGWAAGHLEKNQNLTMSGPYAYTRNPLYVGSLIVVLGFTIAANVVWLMAGFLLVFAFVYVPVMLQEAGHLRRLFPLYAVYEKQVPILFPKLIKALGDIEDPKRFSWAVFRRNREEKAWYGALAGAALLGLKMYFVSYH